MPLCFTILGQSNRRAAGNADLRLKGSWCVCYLKGQLVSLVQSATAHFCVMTGEAKHVRHPGRKCYFNTGIAKNVLTLNHSWCWD